MSADKRWFLVAYDIRDAKRYRKAHKVLKGWGFPVQYSIFRCRLDDRQRQALEAQLATVLDPVDALLIVGLCPSCASKVTSQSHLDDWAAAHPMFAVVGAAPAGDPDQAPRAIGLPQLPQRRNPSSSRRKPRREPPGDG